MADLLEGLRSIRQNVATNQLKINELDNCIEFNHSNGADMCRLLAQWGFETCDYSPEGAGYIVQISLKQPNFYVFLNEIDFGKRVRPFHFYEDLIVLTTEQNKSYCYNHDIPQTFVDLVPVKDDYFFDNVWAYFEFLVFLKELDNNEQDNKAFYFIDHFDDTRNQFVFISPKKEGKLIVPFQRVRPIFPVNKSLRPAFEEFKDSFQERNKHLPKFIKYELFNILPKVDSESRMHVWVEKLSDILHTAYQNFEVYLHDLSLDKLKSDYQKSQEEYFTKLRELLSKIVGQTIAFPLSITATAFATFKVTDTKQPLLTNVLLTLIIFAFLVFTVFSSYLMKIQKFDVDEMKNNADRDFEKLAKNKFFDNPRNANDKLLFESMKGKVINQFRRIDIANKTYFFLQLFFNALFINGIVFQISSNIYLAIIAGLCSMIALFTVYSYFGKYAK